MNKEFVRRLLGSLGGALLVVGLPATLPSARPSPGPSWWEATLSVTVKGSYVIEGGETPLQGKFTCRARWAGTIEPDEKDFLLYHLKTEVLEWRLAEKAFLPGGESLLEAPENSEKPTLRINYVLRDGPDLRFDYEFGEVPIPLHASPLKVALEFPHSPGPGDPSPGSNYSGFVSRGSNRIVIPGSDLERRSPERTFSWEWRREKRIVRDSRTFRVIQHHVVEAVISLVAHGGQGPGLARGSTYAAKARPLIDLGSSGAGVEPIVDAAELFPADMGVDLGRRDLAMTEHELDRPQVRPSFQEVRGE